MPIFRPLNLDQLKEGVESIRRVWSGDRELDCRIAYALGMDWIIPEHVETGAESWRKHVETHGFEGAWVSAHAFSNDTVPCFTSDLNIVFWAMHHFARADEIKLAVDPSGIGARVGRWRLNCDDGPQWWPLGEASHAGVELAFMEALLLCLIHEIETGPEMVAKGYAYYSEGASTSDNLPTT